MQRDLLDALRCPNAHDEAWVVAMVHEARGAELVAATLACPTCGAEFAIDRGVAQFGPVTNRDDPVVAPALAADSLAAMLGVAEGTTPLLLTGAFCASGAALGALVDVPQVWLNAGAYPTARARVAAQIASPTRAPLGAATMAAVAIDAVHAHGAMRDSLIQAVRAGGRVVAPSSAMLPDTLRVLARDDAWQVAETTAPAQGLITLRRRPPDV